MPYRKQIDLPDKTFYVRAGFPDTPPYFSTRAKAIRNATSGYLIINYDDTATYTPVTGVKVVDIGELGVATPIISYEGFVEFDVSGVTVNSVTHTDLSGTLVFARVGVGTYTGTLTGAFTGLTVRNPIKPIFDGTTYDLIGTYEVGITNNNVIGISTRTVLGAASDNFVSAANTFIAEFYSAL